MFRSFPRTGVRIEDETRGTGWLIAWSVQLGGEQPGPGGLVPVRCLGVAQEAGSQSIDGCPMDTEKLGRTLGLLALHGARAERTKDAGDLDRLGRSGRGHTHDDR